MFFYSYGKQKSAQAPTISLIAVRCAACGAPLDAFADKANPFIECNCAPIVRMNRKLNAAEARQFCGMQTCFDKPPAMSLPPERGQQSHPQHTRMSMNGPDLSNYIAPTHNATISDRHK